MRRALCRPRLNLFSLLETLTPRSTLCQPEAILLLLTTKLSLCASNLTRRLAAPIEIVHDPPKLDRTQSTKAGSQISLLSWSACGSMPSHCDSPDRLDLALLRTALLSPRMCVLTRRSGTGICTDLHQARSTSAHSSATANRSARSAPASRMQLNMSIWDWDLQRSESCTMAESVTVSINR